ncbi:uncharacterized protein GGS25DRAFT_525453 [Hypoxylon fragiforme]|uniref:uncharacterized protein n=1 Tax=Hypoxylon fragiforme TaxID=63214 RepID=UPI0020C67095|nr:uncharacterized protein GGS25DRAFT_525453 [Hypoxylon fragiforme]KAI2604175.1 hypothetical protein GGS25DRAFT_525453 [Hypoxylon fragiforme]
MHFSHFAGLLAISANVVFANADTTNPSLNLVRADAPASVPSLRAGFTERRAAATMAGLEARAGPQDQCNAATGFFSTARCVLRRSVVRQQGTPAAFGTSVISEAVSDIWRKITTTTSETGTLVSAEYGDAKLEIIATTGYPSAPDTCTWPALLAGVSPGDLYTVLTQAVLDAQEKGTMVRYFLTSSAGEMYGTILVRAKA